MLAACPADGETIIRNAAKATRKIVDLSVISQDREWKEFRRGQGGYSYQRMQGNRKRHYIQRYSRQNSSGHVYGMRGGPPEASLS